jgi:hypothetical protein
LTGKSSEIGLTDRIQKLKILVKVEDMLIYDAFKSFIVSTEERDVSVIKHI